MQNPTVTLKPLLSVTGKRGVYCCQITGDPYENHNILFEINQIELTDKDIRKVNLALGDYIKRVRRKKSVDCMPPAIRGMGNCIYKAIKTKDEANSIIFKEAFVAYLEEFVANLRSQTNPK